MSPNSTIRCGVPTGSGSETPRTAAWAVPFGSSAWQTVRGKSALGPARRAIGSGLPSTVASGQAGVAVIRRASGPRSVSSTQARSAVGGASGGGVSARPQPAIDSRATARAGANKRIVW